MQGRDGTDGRGRDLDGTGGTVPLSMAAPNRDILSQKSKFFDSITNMCSMSRRRHILRCHTKKWLSISFSTFVIQGSLLA